MSDAPTVDVAKKLHLLEEKLCDECPSTKHKTSHSTPFDGVTCPNCLYTDETVFGTDYDFLFGKEFIDDGCINCGVRLQVTYRLSTGWFTHLVQPVEIKRERTNERYCKGNYQWDYLDQMQELGVQL